MSKIDWRSRKWNQLCKSEKRLIVSISIIAIFYIIYGLIYRVVYIPNWIIISVTIIAVYVIYKAYQAFPYYFNYEADDDSTNIEEDDDDY